MKVDLNKQVKNLGGEEIPGDSNNLGKIVANQLAYSSSGPLVKFMDWARDLHKGNPIEVDRTDSGVLRAFVEGSNLPNLTKEQALDVIDEAAKKTEVPAASNKSRNRN